MTTFDSIGASKRKEELMQNITTGDSAAARSAVRASMDRAGEDGLAAHEPGPGVAP